MFFHELLPCEGLAAYRTTERFLPSVPPHVFGQIVPATETCLADRTRERFFPRVDSQVRGQIVRDREPPAADGATEGFLPGVASHVPHNLDSVQKRFFTA